MFVWGYFKMTLTPYMGLQLPGIGVDTGLTWETSINSNSSVMDQHNHTPGYGAPLETSSFVINADLSMNGYNLTTVRAVRFQVQASPLSNVGDPNAIYISGVDLYYNDGTNQIQITTGGTVNATSSGISDGTATAAFTGPPYVLVVNAASNTPADIQAASIFLGNTAVSGSKYLKLSPPAALANNYTLTFPLIPAQTNVIVLDASGNMATMTYDQVGQGMSSAGANPIANARTRAVGTSVGVGGVALSNTSGVFNTSSTSFVNITALQITIVSAGRPIFVGVIGDSNIIGNPCLIAIIGNTEGSVNFDRNGTSIALYDFANSSVVGLPGSSFNTIDFIGAGTHTYTVQMKVSGNSGFCQYAKLTAYEL